LAGNTPLSEEPVSRFWTKIGLMAELATVFRNASPEQMAYSRMLGLVQGVVPCEAAALYRLSRTEKRLDLLADVGEAISLSTLCELLGAPDLCDWMISHPEAMLLPENHQTHDQAVKSDGSLLIVPLAVEGKPIGVLIFRRDSETGFRDKDVKLLSIIGDQITAFMERSRYHHALKKTNIALMKAQKELKAAQERIIDDEKLKAVRELAVSINHEINNPLSVITGNVEYLLYINREFDEKVIERLRIIHSEASRIAEINRRLLQIQNLFSMSYYEDDDMVTMLDLEKSSVGAKHG
jgi:signal transduction histidine kinase